MQTSTATAFDVKRRAREVAAAIGYAYFNEPTDLIVFHDPEFYTAIRLDVVKNAVMVFVHPEELRVYSGRVYVVTYNGSKIDLHETEYAALYSAIAQGAIPRVKAKISTVTQPLPAVGVRVGRDETTVSGSSPKVIIKGFSAKEVMKLFSKFFSTYMIYTAVLSNTNPAVWRWKPARAEDVLAGLERGTTRELVQKPEILASAIAHYTTPRYGFKIINDEVYLGTEPPLPFRILTKHFTKDAILKIIALHEDNLNKNFLVRAVEKLNKETMSLVGRELPVTADPHSHSISLNFSGSSDLFTGVIYGRISTELSKFSAEELVNYVAAHVAYTLLSSLNPEIPVSLNTSEKGTGVVLDLSHAEGYKKIYMRVVGGALGCTVEGERVVCPPTIALALGLKVRTEPPKNLIMELTKKYGKERVVSEIFSLPQYSVLGETTKKVLRKIITTKSLSKIVISKKEADELVREIDKLRNLPVVAPYIEERIQRLVQNLEVYKALRNAADLITQKP